jgi:hypothetical protein
MANSLKSTGGSAVLSTPSSSAVTTGLEQIIYVGGGKGGIGKSRESLALVDYNETRGIKTLAFDGDLENPTLRRFIDDALPLASQVADGHKAVIAAMEEHSAQRIIVDLGAGTQRQLAEFDRVMGIAEAAKYFKYTPVLVWVLAPHKDSIGLLREAIRAHKKEDGWKLVIARASYEHGSWSLWDNSDTKKEVEQEGPEMYDIPMLDADAFTACDGADLRWRDANRETLKYCDASYAMRWWAARLVQFDQSRNLTALKKA